MIWNCAADNNKGVWLLLTTQFVEKIFLGRGEVGEKMRKIFWDFGNVRWITTEVAGKFFVGDAERFLPGELFLPGLVADT